MRSVSLVSLGMIAAASLGACTCQGVRKPDPQVREVVPVQVFQGLRTPVLLNGSGFLGEVKTHLSSRDEPEVDYTFTVLIGEQEVPAADVAFVSTERLSVLLPSTLPLGVHDVTVITPGGRSGKLSGGFSVIVPPASRISIEDLPDGGGQPVGRLMLTTDSPPFEVHAVWRDDAGSYLGTRAVDWSVTGGIGSVALAADRTRAVFTPTTPGVGHLVADDPQSLIADGQSGLLQVDAGAPASLVWDAISSPQHADLTFPVVLRAVDARGNLATSFGAGAVISSIPAGTRFTCTSGCLDGGVTTPLIGGRWSGRLKLPDIGTGRQMVATAGMLSGTSTTFEVSPVPTTLPPLAALERAPAIVQVGQVVSFDASGSTDDQPDGGLQFSWDFTGTAAGPPPWTPWASRPTADFAYPAAGTVMARVAVRDGEGFVGQAVARVVVVPQGAEICTVTLPDADAVTGAMACAPGTPLSLADAIRISNAEAGKQLITFVGSVTVSGANTYAIGGPVEIVAPPYVILNGVQLSFGGIEPSLLSGVGMRGQGRPPLLVSAGSTLTLEDAIIEEGVTVSGTLLATRSQFFSCPSMEQCIRMVGAARLALSFSDLVAPFSTGIIAAGCAPGNALEVYATTFSFMGTGINLLDPCPGSRVAHVTFHSVGTALTYAGGANHIFVNNVFSDSTPMSTTSCGSASFSLRGYHQLPTGNASCVAADPGTQFGDPLFVSPSMGDFRIRFVSPARDSGLLTPLDVNGIKPGSFEGDGPDRGGAETW